MPYSPENPVDNIEPSLINQLKIIKNSGLYYLNIDIASVLDEEPDAIYCPLVDCDMKRRFAFVVAAVQLHSFVNQHLHHLKFSTI